MTALPLQLLPDNAGVAPDGSLSLAGCSLGDLATEFGTPLFVYDEGHLRARCREAVAAFGPGRAVYATKAFLCLAMARLAYEEGMLLDVASGGELYVALSAGVPADACTFHGNNKSLTELRDAIDLGVRDIVVDSFDEMDRLDALAGDRVPDVLLRITPGVHAHTHEFIATGQDDSKFGFNLANGDALRAVERASGASSMNLVGVHCHIGSNVFEASSFAKAAEVMAAFAVPLDLPELVLGGGLGVAYVGGGYLRLFPYPLMRRWLRQANERGESVILYIHPHDADADQPRLPMPLKRRFKCYHNLHTTLDKLDRLLGEVRALDHARREAAAGGP